MAAPSLGSCSIYRGLSRLSEGCPLQLDVPVLSLSFNSPNHLKGEFIRIVMIMPIFQRRKSKAWREITFPKSLPSWWTLCYKLLVRKAWKGTSSA